MVEHTISEPYALQGWDTTQPQKGEQGKELANS